MSEIGDEYDIDEWVKITRVDRRIVGRLLSYLKPYRLWVVVAVLLLVVSKGIEASVPVLLGRITEEVFEGKRLIASLLVKSCFGIMLLLVMTYVFDATIQMLKNWIGHKAILTLRTQVFEHIQKLEVCFFDHHPVGRLMTRTIQDVDQIGQMFSESAVPMIASFVLLVGIVVGIFFVDWRIGFAVMGILPLVAWTSYLFRTHQRRCYEVARAILSAMNSFIQEHLMGMSVVRNFGLVNQEKKKFEKINEDYRQIHMKTIRYVAMFFASVTFYQSMMLVTVFVTLVVLAPPDVGFRAGVYFTYSLYALMLFRPLSDIAERYHILQAAMAAAQSIFEVLDRVPAPQEVQRGRELEEVKTIEFEKVWFSYENDIDGNNHWVLKDVSFKIDKGESVALVGITGAGKSTIINLLLRFYDVQKGAIKVNGVDIREYSIDLLRRHFGVVFQDPVIFSGSLYDNITLYDSKVTKGQVTRAASYVNLDGLVERLPNGWDQQLRERGISLSLGQMQLIALTRAIAHQRDVLVLDEATANIDSGTERLIREALKKLFVKMTSIVIAHRLSTIKDVHRILVIHRGRLVEEGSHRELLERKGIYEKLYRLLKET